MREQKNTLIMVNSITYAYMARDVLEKQGITAYIERIPADLRKNGCGYGIKIKSDIKKGISIIEKAGITVRDIITF